MARRNSTKRQPVKNSSSDQQPLAQVSISLRLPGQLAKASKSCSNTFGISQNALICVALADYLQSKGFDVHRPF